MQDVFYETPRLPMFILMEDYTLARIRVIKYVDGMFNSVLADWEFDILQDRFYGPELFNEEHCRPFYCLYKDELGEICYTDRDISLIEWAKEQEKKNYNYFGSTERLYEAIIYQAKQKGCPIFESREEATAYVYGLSDYNVISRMNDRLKEYKSINNSLKQKNAELENQ